ncbi:Zn-dependent alcohol dehydrogenase [Mycolicibacterium sp. HK-90]|uniref:Zn-dependent alcohol dehydrogenase n=1 Tax=Mycolicibacterium sp. HK-90 TaxID=3056937 RepID=UPI00265B5430|nr:Zn-dependent alcohol dehydrogenase [Mycolicibacterium sp. HK-90]WKG04006.1 Zn-dependent alcohol dehydrogenase [Mycolicibacterium sp. HK-90]
MRAAVWHGAEAPVTIEDVTLDAPGPNEVRVKIAAAGVCHSDLHIIRQDWGGIAAPMVLGHEGSGTVTEVGRDVTDLSPGDHVVLSWIAPCNACNACHDGRPTQCLTHANTVSAGGVLHDGTSRLHRQNGGTLFHYSGVSSFAEDVVVPASGAIKVRDDAPLEIIALVGCAVATGVGSVLNVAQVRPGSTVLIVGCGGVGLNVAQGARIAGAKTIVAIDVVKEKTQRALELGATHALVAPMDGDHQSQAGLMSQIRRLLPNGADYAFDAIGGKQTAEQCLNALAVGGAAVMVGIPKSGLTAEFEPQKLVDLDQRIIGANYGGIVPAVDIPRLVDLYMDGTLLLDPLVSHRRPLDEAADALNDLQAGTALRQLLIP